MAMTVREMIEKIKTELEAITPVIGRIHARLQFSPEQQSVIDDWVYTDATLGDTIKAFVVKPSNGKETRGTTGANGFALAAQNIKIVGMIGFTQDGTGYPDLILQDEFDKIRTRLRTLTRMQATASGDCFHVGEMDWDEMGYAKICNHNVLLMSLTITIQDRRRAT